MKCLMSICVQGQPERQRRLVNNWAIGCVLDPPKKDVMEQLLIERRFRNVTDVVADSNEGTVMAKDAQICQRTGCLLFVVVYLRQSSWSLCNFGDIHLTHNININLVMITCKYVQPHTSRW